MGISAANNREFLFRLRKHIAGLKIPLKKMVYLVTTTYKTYLKHRWFAKTAKKKGVDGVNSPDEVAWIPQKRELKAQRPKGSG